MLLYLMGLVDILASVFIIVKPGLNVIVWAVIIGLLYKFAFSFWARGFSVKLLAAADLLAAISIYTGFDFGTAIGGILIAIHFVKGFMSFMGLPLLRDLFFLFCKSAIRSLFALPLQRRKGEASPAVAVVGVPEKQKAMEVYK